jgi:hypothetical protein
MQSKILLLALSVTAFGSCSTAYKTGQTPDDVYYSPVKIVEEKKQTERKQDQYEQKSDYEITMGIRDRRWRDFREDYEYDNSPYNYCYCNCKNTSYYYNPYYYPWAIYTTYSLPVNTTPRMVNLNTYNGYNTRVAAGKTNSTSTFSNNSQYNNSNRSGSRVGNILRQTIEPTPSSPSTNNTRTYSPSSSNSSSGSTSSGSSSSGSSSSSSRPARGG